MYFCGTYISNCRGEVDNFLLHIVGKGACFFQSGPTGKNGSILVQMGSDWSKRVTVGPHMSQVVQKCPNWSKLVPNGPNESQLVLTGYNWSK